jgi:MFS family permease
LPINAVDAITLALDHTKQQLFRPFRLGQWTKLALVGLLAGELGSGGCNRANFNFSPTSPHPHAQIPGSLPADPVLLAALVTAAVIAALAVGVILLYASSVMRFALFDSIVTRECRIRWEWNYRLRHGWRYFVWRLGYILLTLAAVVAAVGVPSVYAFAAGWFKEPREHLPVLVIGGAICFLILLMVFVGTAVVLVLTKDFVVPQMALEDVDATEGWRQLWQMMKVEKAAFAGYVGMKIVLAFVATVLIGIATLFLGLILAIPTMALGVLAFLTGKAEGLTWNANTIALAVVVGCVVVGVFLYLISLIYVPAIVFFPAYSVHFFAGRYPRLRAVLYPALPPPNLRVQSSS